MAFVPIRGLSSIADVAKAARLARESIGKVPGVGIELEQLSLNKLKWMASGGRDFRAVTDVLISKMDEAFTAKLMLVMKGKAAITAPWLAAGEAWRKHMVYRLANSGGDIKMKPLAKSTVERKGSTQIGRDTGALYRDMKGATVRNTR
jgi:hypothetical protein